MFGSALIIKGAVLNHFLGGDVGRSFADVNSGFFFSSPLFKVNIIIVFWSFLVLLLCRILSGHSRQKTHWWPATRSGRVASKMTSKRRWSVVHLYKHFITRLFRLTCWRAIFTRWRRFTSSGSSSERGWVTWLWRGSLVCDPGHQPPVNLIKIQTFLRFERMK